VEGQFLGNFVHLWLDRQILEDNAPSSGFSTAAATLPVAFRPTTNTTTDMIWVQSNSIVSGNMFVNTDGSLEFFAGYNTSIGGGGPGTFNGLPDPQTITYYID
jgi:hypothetical protein